MAEAGAVHPGDGEVEVALSGEVAEEEGGGQQLRVRLAVVRVRDQGEEDVAEEVQHDREVGEPAEHDHDAVVAAVAAGVREDLRLVIHEKGSGGACVRGHGAVRAHTPARGGAAAGNTWRRRRWRRRRQG